MAIASTVPPYGKPESEQEGKEHADQRSSHEYPSEPTVHQGTQITLLPSVFTWPNLIIGHEAPDEFNLTYAATAC